MTFTKILQSVWRDAAKVVSVANSVDTVAIPVLTILDPPAAVVLKTVQTVVGAMETVVGGPKQGPVKQAAASSILKAVLPDLSEAAGASVTIDETKLTNLINATVSLNNALAAFMPAPAK
jgi:hypothetical protein